jgi:hypothetical protein
MTGSSCNVIKKNGRSTFTSPRRIPMIIVGKTWHYLIFCTNFLSSPSRPEANSCGASGRFGIAAPSGCPSNVSISPSPKGEEPVNIFDNPES